MASYRYLGGLSRGRPKQRVRVSVDRDKLLVSYGIPRLAPILGWRESLPLSRIIALEIADKTHATIGRVLATGILAFAWKKHDRMLLIRYSASGLESTFILAGSRRALERLHQQILRERVEGESRALDSQTDSQADASLPHATHETAP